jgi:hypothetical protein
MDAQPTLPKSLVGYIHDMGVRALDHLADHLPPEEEAASPGAVQTLVGDWRRMSPHEKEQFVDQVAAAVVDVVAASTLLPAGLKLGKKAAKSARKVIKKRSKSLRKNVKKVAAKAANRKRPAPAKKAKRVKRATKATKAKKEPRTAAAANFVAP